MSRLVCLLIAAAGAACSEDMLFHEPVPLPACVTPTGLCDPPGLFVRRNADELWGSSRDVIAIRKDGRWRWEFLCIEGEEHVLVGFRGDEVWLMCNGELRRSRYPAPAEKVDAGPGVTNSFINLEDDFLIAKADGFYGWNGSGFERVATVPPDTFPSGGLFDLGYGVSRSSFTYGNKYWNGTSWSTWGPKRAEPEVPGRSVNRRAGGHACHDGRYRMVDGAVVDIVDGLRRGNGNVSFFESYDCRSALFVSGGHVFRASLEADPVPLGYIRTFRQPLGDDGVGRAYQLDAHRLLYVAPHNLPEVDIGFWEVHLP